MRVTKRISDIEVLRGIAVLLVCVEHMHMNLFAWQGGPWHTIFYGWTGMWSGVDLFFVISGFVIARDLIPRLEAAETTHLRLVSTLAFWIRRAWRLIPSAWMWLTIILIACVFFDRSGAWGSLRANLEGAISAVFNVANLRVMLTYGKFEAGATFPYWSLSLEEQFYLLLPFVIWLCGRRLPIVLAVVVVLQLVFPRTPLGIICRTDALALGVLIAIWSLGNRSYRLFEPRFLANPWARMMVISILVGGLVFAGGEDFHVPVQISLIAYIGAILVFSASYDRDYILRARWLKTLFLWVGSRSYAIYLIHIPAYFATREIWFRLEPPGTVFNAGYMPAFVATAAGLIVVLSELNYRVLEVPLRRRGAAISDRFRTQHSTTDTPVVVVAG
ncbi:MAG: acyltransferase [Pseudomonadales bacterium]|nr:acyltransferase [Pseudomonadales bacterium]